MADSKIIEKVRKLLALADEGGGGTKHERELAMKRAQELMQKHRIETFQLEEEGKDDSGVEMATFTIRKETDKWQSSLLAVLAEPNFVKVILMKYGRSKVDVMLIGRDDNRAFVLALADHLIPWLDEECKTDTKLQKKKHEADGSFFNPKAFKRSFMHSASATIHQRLRQQIQEAGQLTQMVRYEDGANDDFIAERFGKVQKGRASRSGNVEGHRAGFSAGHRASLSTNRGAIE